MAHKLKIVPDVLGFSETELIIRDFSEYDADIPVTAPHFQLIVPGNKEYEVVTGFVPNTGITINSYKLGLTALNAPLIALPDGVYLINYSVSPHAKVNRTISHFRVLQLRNSILKSIVDNHKTDALEISAFGDLQNQERYETFSICLEMLKTVEAISALDSTQNIEAAAIYDKVSRMYKNALLKVKHHGQHY